ncbi:hypothetical protein E8E14_008136 [Neopestalotiopsis sp. 37M]|nr:hypothetical protein E8E14_008136 [Neopestalotiopsis sp. 37M]
MASLFQQYGGLTSLLLEGRKRRQVGRATTEASIKEFEPTMLEQIDVFINGLTETLNKPVNMKERCSHMSFDIIGLLSFGYALNLQSDTTNQLLPEKLSRENHRVNIYMQIPSIPRFMLQRYFNMFFKKERDGTAELIGTMIRTRMAQDARAKRDLYSFLADSVNNDDESIRIGDLWLEALFFIIAGGDTTSTAMSATLFYLARNPPCYQKLAREIRSMFNNADEICGTAMLKCHYLRACIDEALRMSPPVPGTLWRQLAPEEEAAGPLIVDGHVIPAGTKEYFTQPFVYDPDRWLDLDESNNSTKETPPRASREAFAPFLVGTRGCAGKSMAYLELSLALVKIMWYFDFKPAPGALGNIGAGNQGEFHLYDVFASTYEGPYLVFEKRE